MTIYRPKAGYVSLVALAEVAWTLKGREDVNRQSLIGYLKRLTSIRHVQFQERDAVWEAIKRFNSSNIDFPDHLIERTGHFDGCETTVTFDRKASRTSGFRVLSVDTVAAFRARMLALMSVES